MVLLDRHNGSLYDKEARRPLSAASVQHREDGQGGITMTKKKFTAMAAIILFIHMILIIFYGTQKEAFHEDEYYSYSTSAGYESMNPYGPIQEKSGMDILSYFFVTDELRFDFANVVQIHEKDVHPPLYYVTLHFVMSLFPYSFYKWFGILLNACYSLIACGGIMFFIFHMDKSPHSYFLSLLSGLLYAIHPAFISNVMLTRMYCMSVMWTVLFIDVFVMAMQNLTHSRKRFAAITLCGAATCYFAFLTHYFCLYIPFFLTLGFCIYAVVRTLCYKEKCFLRMLLFGASLLAALGLAFLTFPSSIDQILSEERGEAAFGGLFGSDLFSMLKLFLPVLNKNFFSGMLYPIMGILMISLLIGIIFILKRKHQNIPMPRTNFAILGIGLPMAMITVWITSKTALFLGDASCRYFYPAAALLLPFIAYTICKAVFLAESLFSTAKAKAILSIALAIGILLPAIAGHIQGNILFLYQDKAETLQYARDNAQYPLVMIYDPNTRYKTMYIANELWPFERIVFIRYDEEATVIESDTLKSAEKLIVYMDGPEEILDRLVAQNDRLNSWSLLRHDKNYYVYVLE